MTDKITDYKFTNRLFTLQYAAGRYLISNNVKFSS